MGKVEKKEIIDLTDIGWVQRGDPVRVAGHTLHLYTVRVDHRHPDLSPGTYRAVRRADINRGRCEGQPRCRRTKGQRIHCDRHTRCELSADVSTCDVSCPHLTRAFDTLTLRRQHQLTMVKSELKFRSTIFVILDKPLLGYVENSLEQKVKPYTMDQEPVFVQLLSKGLEPPKAIKPSSPLSGISPDESASIDMVPALELEIPPEVAASLSRVLLSPPVESTYAQDCESSPPSPTVTIRDSSEEATEQQVSPAVLRPTTTYTPSVLPIPADGEHVGTADPQSSVDENPTWDSFNPDPIVDMGHPPAVLRPITTYTPSVLPIPADGEHVGTADPQSSVDENPTWDSFNPDPIVDMGHPDPQDLWSSPPPMPFEELPLGNPGF